MRLKAESWNGFEPGTRLQVATSEATVTRGHPVRDGIMQPDECLINEGQSTGWQDVIFLGTNEGAPVLADPTSGNLTVMKFPRELRAKPLPVPTPEHIALLRPGLVTLSQFGPNSDVADLELLRQAEDLCTLGLFSRQPAPNNSTTFTKTPLGEVVAAMIELAATPPKRSRTRKSI